MKKIFGLLKYFIFVFLIIIYLYSGIKEFLYKFSNKIGDIGMDDVGRELLIQTINKPFEEFDNLEYYVKGLHRTQIVFSMDNYVPIITGYLNIDTIIYNFTKPYDSLLIYFDELTLRGDKLTAVNDDPVPIDSIRKKLKKLNAINIADFFASCGFESFSIVNKEENLILIKLLFSSENYGHNPIFVESNIEK